MNLSVLFSPPEKEWSKVNLHLILLFKYLPTQHEGLEFGSIWLRWNDRWGILSASQVVPKYLRQWIYIISSDHLMEQGNRGVFFFSSWEIQYTLFKAKQITTIKTRKSSRFTVSAAIIIYNKILNLEGTLRIIHSADVSYFVELPWGLLYVKNGCEEKCRWTYTGDSWSLDSFRQIAFISPV